MPLSKNDKRELSNKSTLPKCQSLHTKMTKESFTTSQLCQNVIFLMQKWRIYKIFLVLSISGASKHQHCSPWRIKEEGLYGLLFVAPGTGFGWDGASRQPQTKKDCSGHKKRRPLWSSFCGARNRTWTCTPFGTRTWNVRVYQFRHPGIW